MAIGSKISLVTIAGWAASAENTHLLIGKERKRVEIPVQSMLLFRGDLPHASNAGTHFAVEFEAFPIFINFFFYNRAGSNQAHFSAQNIPDLRQLV